MLKSQIFFLQNSLSDDRAAYRIRNVFRVLAIGLAGLHAWAAITSHSMNADGISYLDIGDAYFRGDWENAINPVWPPLYSWILGLVNYVFKPSMEWEFPTVHILNFAVFLLTMACFEFMWGKLRYFSTRSIQTGFTTLPDWSWWAIGYCLFIWTSLGLIQIWAVTPDMLMAALLFLAVGLIIQIRNNSQGWYIFFLLGLILGLGYLTKTFMFTMAFVFLGISFLLGNQTRESVLKTLLALSIFLMISLPFIYLISEKKGKLTIGEAGTVTYMRYVHGIPFPHWQGNPEQFLELTHPSRLINQLPPVYEFGEPIGGTYPISNDPSYWYEGVDLPFNLGNQLQRLFTSGVFLFDLFFIKQGVLIASVSALIIMSQKRRLSPFELFQRWILVIPAVIAIGLYGLVLVSGRYIAAFIILFWTDILANVSLTDTENNRSWLKLLSSLAIIGVLVNILLFNLDGFNRLNPSIQSSSYEQSAPNPSWPGEVSLELQQLNIEEGTKVAIIGYGFDAFWARLARVKIVAEMLSSDATEFWLGDNTLRQIVLRAFASAGAKAVVAEYVPPYARMDGWHQVGNSNYYIYMFEE